MCVNFLGFSTAKDSHTGKDGHTAGNSHDSGVIQGPGAKTGTIGSDFDQAVGVERLELLSKLAGRPIFSSSEVLCHPRGEGIKGTVNDPVLVETLARSGDAVEVMERIVGCSGVPKGSHEIGFFWVRSEGEPARCPECGQAFKLKPILE